MIEAHGSLAIQAKEMAIKALKQEPCEDCISRQGVINAIANTCFFLSSDDWNELMTCINRLPSIQPKTDILDKIITDISIEILIHSETDLEVVQAYADGLKKGLKIINKYRKGNNK